MSARRQLAAVPKSDLDRLADRATAEHAAYEATQSAAIAHAIACGEALIAAKAQLKHGDWLPWLAERVQFSRWTAANYMRIAANGERVPHFDSVRSALAELAEPRPKPPPPTEHQQRMRELSARFDRLVGCPRPTAPGYAELDRYVPQGSDPRWRLGEALAAAERTVDHAQRLDGLGEHERRVYFKGRKRETRRLLAELRAAADRLEMLLEEDERP